VHDVYRLECYLPPQIRTAYGVTPLLDGARRIGHDDRDRRLVRLATIEHDLQVFDQAWACPTRTSRRSRRPGRLPPFDATDPEMAGWAFETTLDVEYAT